MREVSESNMITEASCAIGPTHALSSAVDCSFWAVAAYVSKFIDLVDVCLIAIDRTVRCDMYVHMFDDVGARGGGG